MHTLASAPTLSPPFSSPISRYVHRKDQLGHVCLNSSLLLPTPPPRDVPKPGLGQAQQSQEGEVSVARTSLFFRVAQAAGRPEIDHGDQK